MKKLYAVKHQSADVIMNSRSGGAFTALSDFILSEGGSVYGAVFSSELEIEHVRATDVPTRDKMRGSKYVQSSIGETFRKIRNDLEKHRKVLFTGTSCQVAGLKKYLNQDYDNLFCVDIVCHGVSSPKVWKDYLKWQEKKGEIESFEFRNKRKFGWNSHVETITYSHGKVKNSTVYASLYYSNYMFRPSCYSCLFATLNHPGDITIADYWGVEKAAPEYNDNIGTSLVILNTEKGEYLFKQSNKDLIYKETKIEDSMQRPFLSPPSRPKNRSVFWADVNSKRFTKIAKQYGKYGFVNAVKKNIKKLIRRRGMK